MPYSPKAMPPINDLETLRGYVEEELRSIERELSETVAVDLRPIYAAPTRPRNGMVVYADGTHWNPGAGEGLYAREASAWVKL